MSAVRRFIDQVRAFIRRNTGWIGEFVTAWVVIYWTTASICGADDKLLPSLRVLTQVVGEDALYAAAYGIAGLQLIGILGMLRWPDAMRWVRWAACILMVILWLALTWGLMIALGFHSSQATYLGYVALNAYAALSLLQDEP